ncbi:hypothetical protein ES703_53235 [subsurface metagenome]
MRMKLGWDFPSNLVSVTCSSVGDKVKFAPDKKSTNVRPNVSPMIGHQLLSLFSVGDTILIYPTVPANK